MLASREAHLRSRLCSLLPVCDTRRARKGVFECQARSVTDPVSSSSLSLSPSGSHAALLHAL
jgi:hypothetical protein